MRNYWIGDPFYIKFKESLGKISIFLSHDKHENEVNLFTWNIWKPVKGLQANSADPGQMAHNVAFDPGLHCLLTGFSIKNRIKEAH